MASASLDGTLYRRASSTPPDFGIPQSDRWTRASRHDTLPFESTAKVSLAVQGE
jgi:hypothetical protein